jgi:hypothetical protein
MGGGTTRERVGPPVHSSPACCARLTATAAFNQLKTPVEKSDAWVGAGGAQSACITQSNRRQPQLTCLLADTPPPPPTHTSHAHTHTHTQRYHVLCGHGGVYADTDTLCVRPFSSWANFNSTPQPGLIVGVENRCACGGAGVVGGWVCGGCQWCRAVSNTLEREVTQLLAHPTNRFHSQAEAEEATYVHKIQMTQVGWCRRGRGGGITPTAACRAQQLGVRCWRRTTLPHGQRADRLPCMLLLLRASLPRSGCWRQRRTTPWCAAWALPSRYVWSCGSAAVLPALCTVKCALVLAAAVLQQLHTSAACATPCAARLHPAPCTRHTLRMRR